ncbi:MAG: O-antigen ligase family protein [Desulfonauticus sp.]|nr:O-antigen ligase family protein [Desulfonauticus sp.]
MPKVIVISVTIAALTAAIGFFFKIEDWTAPVEVPAGVLAGRGVAVSANNLSLMIVFAFPLMWHWFIYSSRAFSKQMALILMILNFIGLVSTFSRSGFLLFNITLFMLIFQYRHKFFTIRYLGVILSVFFIVIVVVILFIPKSYIERQKSLLLGTRADTSIERRADYIPVALDAFKKHPLIGTGMYTFRIIWTKSERAQKLRIEEREAHNTYLDVLVGTGIIGLTLFFALILQCIKNFSQAIKVFESMNDEETASIIKAYRISFIAILIDFLTYSVIEHNFFVIGIALSAFAVKMAEEAKIINNSMLT